MKTSLCIYIHNWAEKQRDLGLKPQCDQNLGGVLVAGMESTTQGPLSKVLNPEMLPVRSWQLFPRVGPACRYAAIQQ